MLKQETSLRKIIVEDKYLFCNRVQDAGQTDRQTDSMTLAEPTPDMTERKCFSNVLTARVLKSRWTETTRSVEQSL